MKSIFPLVLAIGLALPSLAAAETRSPNEPKLWRGYSGVSWDAAGKRDRVSAHAPIAGLHFSGDGKAFVSVPRWIVPAVPATLNILSTDSRQGPARLTAFPSPEWNSADATPSQTLRNVLGFHIDETNHWLWALEMGFVAGEADAPA